MAYTAENIWIFKSCKLPRKDLQNIMLIIQKKIWEDLTSFLEMLMTTERSTIYF